MMNYPERFLNQVVEGDCLQVMKELPDGCIDMILCDLPYGTTGNPWDRIIDFDQLWAQYRRIIKPAGVIALTGQGAFTAQLILSNRAWFRYKFVWIKSKAPNFLWANKQPLRKHEDVCIFYARQPRYQPQMQPGRPYVRGWRKESKSGSYNHYRPAYIKSEGLRYPNDLLFFEEHTDDWFYCKTAEAEGRNWHPTQKPVALGRYLVRTYTQPGDVVLDSACGCGSFLVSAVLEDRQFIGIEKNEGGFHLKDQSLDFVAISRDRVRLAGEQKNLLTT